MKEVFTTILTILYLSCFSQTDCEIAEMRATRDFTNNNFSLHSLEVLPVNNTYFYVLREYYSVNWYFTDSLDYYHCYDSIMILQLNNKFKHDFISRARKIADSLNNTSNWMKEAEFPGGKAELYKYIVDRINLKGLSHSDLNGSKIFVQFEIDSTGRIYDAKIMQGINAALDKQIIKIVESMPDWIPKYEFGKPIRTRVTYPIIIEYR